MNATRRSTSTPAASAALTKLARGRHPLTMKAVADSQRTRLLDAVATVVANKGYSAATVADVIALAGVSRRTFYEFFPNIEDCFLAAYDRGMRALFTVIRESLQGEAEIDWRERTRTSIEAYLRALVSAPDAAWAYTIEVLGAGRKVLKVRAWVMSQWVLQWRALQDVRVTQSPAATRVTDDQLLALVGGIEELVRSTLLNQGAEHLPAMSAAATELAVTVLGGTVRPA